MVISRRLAWIILAPAHSVPRWLFCKGASVCGNSSFATALLAFLVNPDSSARRVWHNRIAGPHALGTVALQWLDRLFHLIFQRHIETRFSLPSDPLLSIKAAFARQWIGRIVRGDEVVDHIEGASHIVIAAATSRPAIHSSTALVDLPQTWRQSSYYLRKPK